MIVTDAARGIRERKPEHRHDLIVDILAECADADDENARPFAFRGHFDMVEALRTERPARDLRKGPFRRQPQPGQTGA